MAENTIGENKLQLYKHVDSHYERGEVGVGVVGAVTAVTARGKSE